MKPFPTSRNSVCKYYLDKSVDHLHSLVQELKIENVEDNFFKDIVIPLSVYLDVLPKKEKPYFLAAAARDQMIKLMQSMKLLMEATLFVE